MKTISRLGLLLVPTLLPLTSFAATVVGGTSGNGGFLGVSGGSGSFGISWGSGAAMCANNLCSVAATILFIINGILVPLLFAIAFIMFLYGVASAYIFSRGDEGAIKKGHQLILWGVIGFAVMISLWGLVNVVANTFGLTGVTAPPSPSSCPGGICPQPAPLQ